MISRARCALLLVCLASSAAGTAHAQTTTIVIAPRSSFADTLADRLRAGLESTATSTTVQIADGSAGCDPQATATSDAAPRSPSTTLTILVAQDATIAFCTRSHDTFTQRAVGPFPALDATAVEQIATMVEASLEALATPDASRETLATSDADTTHTTAPAATPEAPQDEAIAVPPNTSNPLTDVKSTQPSAAPTQPTLRRTSDGDHDHLNASTASQHARSPIALTLGVGPVLWDAKSIAIDGHLGARHAIVSRWLAAALALTYGLPFERTISGLGARFSILALDALVVFAIHVSDDAAIDLSLGPRAQWLFVRPFAVEGSNATAGNDSYAFNLSGVLEASPRIEITRHLWLSATLGVVFASNPRAYGFERGEHFETILDQSIPRPYLRLGALLAL